MAHPLRDKAAVSGIGETAYTRGTPKGGLALQLEASLAAIADAGLSPRDIVTISQLISFASYQVRLLAGLRLLAEEGGR